MKSKNQIRKSYLTRFSVRRISMISGGIVIIVCAVMAFILLTQPQRTVVNFCRIAKEEKSILTGDANYQQQLTSYQRLEAVSPDAIQPDITTIRKGYEDIVNNPSSTLSVGFGISGAENGRTAYITANCPNF